MVIRPASLVEVGLVQLVNYVTAIVVACDVNKLFHGHAARQADAVVIDKVLPTGTAGACEDVVPFKEVGIGTDGVERRITFNEPTDSFLGWQVVVVLFFGIGAGFGQRVTMGEVVATFGNVAGT